MTERITDDQLHMRPCRPEDADALRRITIAAWTPVYESLRRVLGDDLFVRLHTDCWQDKKAGEVFGCLREHPENLLVTEHGGQVVGFISFWLDTGSRVATIGNNAVDPACQGRGVGTWQYRRILDLFRERGMRYAQVLTGLDDAHASARRAYERVGFGMPLPRVLYSIEL